MAKRKSKASIPLLNCLRWLCFGTLAFSAILAPLFVTSGYEPDFSMNSLYLAGLCSCLLVYSFVCVTNKKIEIQYNGLSISLLALVTIVTLSMLWAHNLYEALIKYQYWIAALIAFFLVKQLCQQHRHIEQLLLLLMISGTVVSLIGMLQYWFQIDWIPQGAPPASTFANKNFAAQYVTLTSPITFYYLLTSQRQKLLWFSGISLAVMLAYIVYTQTRAAWVAFIVQSIVAISWLFYQHFKYPDQQWFTTLKLKVLTISLMLLLLFIMLTPEGLSLNGFSLIASQAQTIAEDASTEYRQGSIRLVLWLNSLLIFSDHWLTGVGLGNWQLYYPLYHQRSLVDWLLGAYNITANAHNDYLHYLAELGLIGAIASVAVLFFAIKLLFAGFRFDAPKQPIFLLLAMSTMGIATEMIFSFPMQKPSPLVLSAVFFALLVIQQQNNQKLQIRSSAILQSSVAISFILLACSLYFGAKLYQSTNSYYKMFAAAGVKHSPSIIQYSNETLKILPWRHDLYYYIGSAYRNEKQHQLAVENFEKTLKSYPYHIPSLTKIYKSYLTLKQPEKAKHYALRLLETSPRNAEAHRRLGILYNNTYSDPLNAVKHLKQALELDPDIKNAEELRRVVDSYEKQLGLK